MSKIKKKTGKKIGGEAEHSLQTRLLIGLLLINRSGEEPLQCLVRVASFKGELPVHLMK